jgi:hypothetical protein
VRDAYGLDRVPVPMKMERGGPRAVESRDLVILGGTLRLLAAVTPEQRQASLAVTSGDEELNIAVTMPLPA